ncbi:MAG: NUDIX hydrolase [Lachnospiraceae bacterium]|nr:NUDIX hydrolase [Lachnospiraceae bacterium]
MEYFDVYNDKKELTGRTLPRKGSRLQEGEYQLIVLALIERPDHKFLITRRSLNKKWAAGAWEVSGGGVLAGETSYDAVLREVKEETGLDISGAEGRCVYTYSNVDLDRGDNYFVDIYHFHMDFTEDDVTIEASEAIDFAIVPFDEIRKQAADKNFLHYERILQAFEAEGYEV